MLDLPHLTLLLLPQSNPDYSQPNPQPTSTISWSIWSPQFSCHPYSSTKSWLATTASISQPNPDPSLPNPWPTSTKYWPFINLILNQLKQDPEPIPVQSTTKSQPNPDPSNNLNHVLTHSNPNPQPSLFLNQILTHTQANPTPNPQPFSTQSWPLTHPFQNQIPP